MNTTTEHCQLDKELTLRNNSELPITVRVVDLSFTKQEDSLSECHLTLEISPELYQHIDNEALFNLKPELRGPFTIDSFQPEIDIAIEATLQPDLLPQLSDHATDPEETATYLQNLSQQQSDNSLVSTESWFALHVKQAQDSGVIGYRTFWAYVDPFVIAQEATSKGQISQAMINFFKDWADTDMSAVTETAISESVEEITKAFDEFADTGQIATEAAISEIFEEVTHAFEELADAANDAIAQSVTFNKPIGEEVINFFIEDDWPFTKIQGEPVLLTAFQGKNGKWTCYAKTRDEHEQFVFYSICPVNAPENKHLSVADFLMRANSGMIIGNFELDFASGEICYKTSIDVKGDFLSFEIIKQLVYANVTMMDTALPAAMRYILIAESDDRREAGIKTVLHNSRKCCKYLPGIIAVIESDAEPKDMITQLEL
ncbi:YbjN domain-containing protein [Nostoc sp.]|uniref:YbjN domain-containing protein n=1 Tax=Nostoc sp. TaxID=1180 RepID=UPI0035938612